MKIIFLDLIFFELGYSGAREDANRLAGLCLNEELECLRDFEGVPDLRGRPALAENMPLSDMSFLCNVVVPSARLDRGRTKRPRRQEPTRATLQVPVWQRTMENKETLANVTGMGPTKALEALRRKVKTARERERLGWKTSASEQSWEVAQSPCPAC